MDGQTVVIDDYLAIRPEARARLDHAVLNSRIEVGPWYTLPDEFLVSGETLVRNLRRGIALADEHGGCLKAGYLPDSFGHPAQMPQIYRQFGFRHAVVWRGVPLAIDRLAFIWRAPDGSEVLTAYMGTSYSHGVDLPTDAAALAARITGALSALAPFNPEGDVLLMNGNDHVLPQRGLPASARAANEHLQGVRLKVAGLGEYLDRLAATNSPPWVGELRSSARANVLMGTLSVRVPDKQAYLRACLRLERAAEPLAALSGLDCSGLLEQAWTSVLQNAAHDTACGSGIDEVAEESRLRSAAAQQIADAVASRCLARLAGDRQAWNPSPFPRRGLVEIEVDVVPPGAQELPDSRPPPLRFRFPAEEVGRVHAVLDERRIAGERIRTVAAERHGATLRVTAETRLSGPATNLEGPRMDIERLAVQPGVEAIEVEIRRGNSRRVLIETPWIPGCSVTSIGQSGTKSRPGRVSASGDCLENDQLRCQLAADGTLMVEHKASGLIYNGLNQLVDESDAGDEYNFSPADGDTLRPPPHPEAEPIAHEHGPLRAALNTSVRLTVPAGLGADRRPLAHTAALTVALSVSLERDSSRLEITMEVTNAARDHRLRALFPLPFEASLSNADTAYHVTGRPVIAAHRDAGSPELELPTYPMRSFVDLNESRGGLAVISEGLHEYEVIPGAKPELALTLLRSVGWLSRDDLRYRTGHAGPPMETPGAQLLGTHHFRYCLLFHGGDWESGGVWRAAESFLLPILAGSGVEVGGIAPSIQIEPACIQMTACIPYADGYELRLLNASDEQQTARIEIAPGSVEIQRQTLIGEVEETIPSADGTCRLSLRSWEIVTLRIRRNSLSA